VNIVAAVLKENLQMVSEQFQMNAGSKCANWKAIIFDVAEKS